MGLGDDFVRSLHTLHRTCIDVTGIFGDVTSWAKQEATEHREVDPDLAGKLDWLVEELQQGSVPGVQRAVGGLLDGTGQQPASAASTTVDMAEVMAKRWDDPAALLQRAYWLVREMQRR